MKRTVTILITLVVLIALTIPVASQALAYSGIPTFSIVSVVKDSTVTIQTYNFPAAVTFTVTMGPFGSAGIGGIVVDSTNSDVGGAFQKTYTIPAALAGSSKIAIRLQSPTTGFFAYNWFWNNTATVVVNTPVATATAGPSPTPGPTATPKPVYSGHPVFSISAVQRDNSVTISGSNFPPNDNFVVTMGLMGTRGVGGTVVTTTNSGAGGSLTATYTIPSGLAGLSQISIRLQSPTSGFFAYNWFWNFNAP